MPRKSRFVALGAALLAVTAVPALAADGEEVTTSWANVNICNPQQLGVRAQLAGDGSKDTMRVRFSAEWLSPDGWVPLAGQASSPWLDAGRPSSPGRRRAGRSTSACPAGPRRPGRRPQLPAPRRRRDAVRIRRSATQTTGVCAIGG